MKRVLLFACWVLVACGGGGNSTRSAADSVVQRDTSNATTQGPVNTLSPIDISPLDVSYCPADYPVQLMSGKVHENPLARVLYSRPHKGGRVIFGNLLKYGEPWRLGANEATELELFTSAVVQGRAVPAGRYVLYCIPGPNEWVIVFNRKLYSWGLHQDPKQDAFRFTVPVTQDPNVLEHFTMVFHRAGNGADLVIGWDDVRTRLNFVFSKQAHS
jgi:hypothetical protein